MRRKSCYYDSVPVNSIHVVSHHVASDNKREQPGRSSDDNHAKPPRKNGPENDEHKEPAYHTHYDRLGMPVPRNRQRGRPAKDVQRTPRRHLGTRLGVRRVDGRQKDEPVGPGVKGLAMWDGNGHYSWQMMSADRSKTASDNPRNPVGQAIAHFGTYTVDDVAKTLTNHVERCTFPQWDGAAAPLILRSPRRMT
jgi:hypothetical protein